VRAATPDRDPPPLLEREEELGRIRALLDRAATGDGGVLVVEGPAGIGKTGLLRAARAEAPARGMRAGWAAGSELEREFGHGVTRQALEPLLRGQDPVALDGPARLAAGALGLAAGSGAGAGAAAAGDAYGVIHGLYWLTADLAAVSPLLLAVDDLQWADAPSQRFLAYLARRLEGLRVAVLVALRPALPGEDRALAEALAGAAREAALRPRPLSPAGVEALATAALGASAGARLAGECHAASGGNPLLAGELLAELRARDLAPGDGTAIGLGRVGPERVARNVRQRVAALAPDGPALTRAVAVLGDDGPVDVAADLAGLDREGALRAAAGLAAADVLADDLPLRFRHPVVREAVLGDLPGVERAAAHGRAARLLAARGAPAGVVAAHLRLAPAEADPWAVERLRAAAREARAQGAPDVAAAQLARALAEPPPEDERGEVLHELGSAALAAGRPDGPVHLRAALAALRDPRVRAVAALELATSLYERLRMEESAEVLRAARADLGDADSELALVLEAELATVMRMRLGGGEDTVARFTARVAGLRGETPAERFALASAAGLRPDATAREHAEVAELLDAALAGGPLPVPVPETGIVTNLIRAGRLDAAEDAVARRLERAQASGSVVRFALMLQMRAWIALERGALPAAEADLARALELAEELGAQAGGFAVALGQVLAERGRGEEGEALLVAHGLTGDLPEHQVMNVALAGRATVRLAQGRDDAALADLLELGRRYAGWGIQRPVPPWRSLAALALLRRGERAEAQRLAAEELALARRWGTPAAIGIAQRALGLVSNDLALLEAAVATLAPLPWRLELARAEVELGAALRRARRRADAREPLRRGMDRAHLCGAAALAERARDELRATGARPRRLVVSGPLALTASERRVAELAARGLTNRAIAQGLFVAPATVETHLRHAFQKLDVRSRGELTEALARGSPPA
jgi:DNA-binding CsgD family transcriptional regulator/tetratricopeptide (TPR) repeat protein